MKETRLVMGMPVTVLITDEGARRTHHVKEDVERAVEEVFAYFTRVDERFSTYKTTSEITAINEGRIPRESWSPEMEIIFTFAEDTKRATGGYFDITRPDGSYDPSGLVKGWAIWNAAQILLKKGFHDFYVDAGGDIQPHGMNEEGEPWRVGVKNPWNEEGHVQTVLIAQGEGVATSGTYIRGTHIYAPHAGAPAAAIASLTVSGPHVYEADRFATAAFAMGRHGIQFIESLPGFEGYMIGRDKVATKTAGWDNYVDQFLFPHH